MMSEVPQYQQPGYVPQPPGPPKLSGCAIGCLIASAVLFGLTIAGAIYALWRTGNLPAW